MKPLLLFFALITCIYAQPFHVANLTDLHCPYADQLADCVYRAEGGLDARVPYGVLSVRVRDAHEARVVTLRSIDLNYGRWIRAGRPGGNSPDAFVAYMGARWCPVVSDPVGHRNWVRNVRALLARELRLTSYDDRAQ